MKVLRSAILAAAITLVACGQQQPVGEETTPPPAETPAQAGAALETASPSLPPVDAVLLAASNDDFTAIEPSEVGVFGAPTVMEALAPLLGHEEAEGGGGLQLSLRDSGEGSVADIVRTGLADDSVTAGHVRIEFRREPDGWYPTNAYRRSQCARGALAGQWTTELCP